MHATVTITSPTNPRLKAIRRLARRRCRDVANAFLIEGYAQLRAALEAGARIREVYVAPELSLGADDDHLVALAARSGACVLELGPAAFRSISGNVRPDGLAALVARWPTALGGLAVAEQPLLLIAESVERPGNLGALVRTAAGAGAEALIVCEARTDVFHPETVRASVGAIFRLALAEATLAESVAWLAARDIRIVVACPDAAAEYWQADYRGATAIVFGSERHGITKSWRERAEEAVRIPMSSGTDSLNVAVAAGIVAYEAARQRSYGTGR